MFGPMTRSAALAVVGATIFVFWQSSASAHAVCGQRVFPATLAIDDPGVGDELALPTLSVIPQHGDGVRETDLSFAYSKTILPTLAFSISDGRTWLQGSGAGWGNLSTGLKYNVFCDAAHEFMGSVGVDVSWARTGTNGFSDPFNTYSPTVNLGKGLGDLPKTFDALRPIAVTAQFGLDVPGQSHTSTVSYDPIAGASLDVEQNPSVFNWGLTIQYSLPYMNANVRAVDSDFLRRLTPIAEFSFARPISNYAPGQGITTGTFQPGVIYSADTWQFALEALVPVNAASGRHVGMIGELHFFLDDIFPNTLGKPLFGGSRT